METDHAPARDEVIDSSESRCNRSGVMPSMSECLNAKTAQGLQAGSS